ncbi:DUF6759 domain-containing protein [Epilithonimonas caeni]|uniref:DUF6759 domain-containing protein n=1 Tax=Epilithonimonas caeni TaxID=365343 RepID=UPI00047FD0F8|nr:DUF6759 domain-containing protein [Epilithonimonas caeni]
MNKLILLILGSCLMSCATSSVSPILRKNSEVSLKIDQFKPSQEKLSIENKAVTLLNQLFNSDESNKNMVLIINNDSDCDFTMNIAGAKNYSLPVGSKKAESIILEQGDYELTSEVCNGAYKTKKTFAENTQLNIKYTFVKNEPKPTEPVIQ